MTTATLPPLARAPRPTHGGVLRAELLKLTSLRGILLAMLVTVAAGVIGALVQDGGRSNSSATLLGSVAFSSAVIAVIGALSSSSEYATKTIQPSLMAVPRRLRFVVAKAIVVAAVGSVLTLIGSLVGLAATGSEFEPSVVGPVLGCAAYGAATGAFAVFFGLVVRSSAGSVAGILGLAILTPGLLGGVRIGDRFVTDFTMAEAGGGIALASHAGDALMNGLVLLMWVAVGALAAAVRIRLSDA